MSDDHSPEWFAPKRYGFGSGRPISWQGRVLLLAYFAFVGAATWRLGERPLQLFAAVAPLTILLMIICARTTRGGWRWRWGDPD